MPYDSAKPIADRLLPGDKQVLVQMESPKTPDPGPEESFEREIQRLGRTEIVALVRVATAHGEIADRGTWIRTTVKVGVDRLVKAPAALQLGESIEFTYAAGSAQIGNVVVTTGNFPRFVEGQQYLVFLMTRPAMPSSPVWGGVAFRVDEQGVLQRVGLDGGGEQSFRTTLVGRNASEVIDALMR